MEYFNNEIDLIALNSIDKTAVIAEVKRNSEMYNPEVLQKKYQTIKSEFSKYKKVEIIGLSMNDM